MLTGLRSTLDRTEMGNAQRTQNRSLFWLETVIGADSLPACKTLAAAVQSRRGENRLHRRWMIARQRLYRRRFPKALRPLVPSTRCLVSAAEVAHLLELPTARMKGVPVRRLMLPRIPAPPELERAVDGGSGGLWPVLRAENAQVAIRAIDRKYGVLAAGGQGAGKTAALLALYRSDLADRDAAPIVADPKSEIAPLCLAHTPPDCGKQVWYLDLGRPAFGMNPLLRAGERALALEAAEIAENVVAALLDVNEDQIFASSRRYLGHAVIGALALAETEQRRPTFEDMHSLLEPANQELRNRAGQACADIPNLDVSAHFLRVELPNELRLATSQTTVRMDAPRNKISTLLQAAPIRRFLHHPTNVSIRQIIQARDVLIIDCAQGQVGDDNVKPMLLFMLRTLHRQMQRQVTLPEDQRPRVPVIIDEAHYVADTENFVDQIATHRRAGLEMACGIQYFAQLGSGSRHAEKIRKGILNLLQSRLLFRMGDAEDAQQATRIAMAVYATMIRDDPDSRARMRVTPEQLLNFPNHHCLASWIANGTRAPSFTGQTYPLPDPNPDWAQHHLSRQAGRVGPYPEHLQPATLDTHSVTANSPGDGSEPAHRDQEAGTSTTSTSNGTQLTAADADRDGQDAPARKDARGPEARKRELRVDYEPPPPLPNLADSPARRIVGRRVPGPPPGEHDTPAPASLRELAYLDRINEIGPADELDGAAKLPRLYDADYAILALLDRAGLVPRTMIGRSALPGRGANAVSDRLTKLYRHGLIAQHPVGIREHTRSDGKPPLLYSITRRGMEVAQTREPPAISQRRQWRAIEPGRGLRLAHDLHALAWAIELHRLLGNVATDHWRTPRYATGRIPVPQTGSSRGRHPITINEIPVPDKQAIIDVALNPFTEIQPDLSLELRIPSINLTFDLLVELDLTSRPSYNRDKLLGYDAFLCGWSLAHPRYQTHATRPIAVFVCPDPHAALALAQEADEALTGRIGVMGTGPEHWYHPARDHTFFAVEADIHHGNLSALALPARPPGLRQRLTGTRDLELERVALLPDTLIPNKRNK
jgi:Type IV secretion-system coupling protein DNA-binding domain